MAPLRSSLLLVSDELTRRSERLLGKSRLAQAIGQAAIQQGYRVPYRETHALLDELAEASIDGMRKQLMASLMSLPLLIIDDLGMRKFP